MPLTTQRLLCTLGPRLECDDAEEGLVRSAIIEQCVQPGTAVTIDEDAILGAQDATEGEFMYVATHVCAAADFAWAEGMYIELWASESEDENEGDWLNWFLVNPNSAGQEEDWNGIRFCPYCGLNLNACVIQADEAL